MNETTWVIVAGIVSTVSAFIVARWQRPKIVAETQAEAANATERLSMISLQLVEPLDARIHELERVVEELRAENAKTRERILELERGVNLLRGQIYHLGETPVWPPRPDQ